MKKYCLIDASGRTSGEFLSKCPRGAALKVATKMKEAGRINLYDVDTGGLHIFEGGTRPLEESEKTAFTRSHNITHKPIVRKLLYDKSNQVFDDEESRSTSLAIRLQDAL